MRNEKVFEPPPLLLFSFFFRLARRMSSAFALLQQRSFVFFFSLIVIAFLGWVRLFFRRCLLPPLPRVCTSRTGCCRASSRIFPSGPLERVMVPLLAPSPLLESAEFFALSISDEQLSRFFSGEAFTSKNQLYCFLFVWGEPLAPLSQIDSPRIGRRSPACKH